MTLYGAARRAVTGTLGPYFNVEVSGADRIPSAGAFILAPVHRSFLDFALVSTVTSRRLRYMAKDTLWKVPWFGRVLEELGAFPVHRGSVDRPALRRTMEVIAAGDGVVIFPEGTRRSGPVVERLFDGVAYVACRQGVPIVPVGIGGSEEAMPKGTRVPRRMPIDLVVGEPMPCSVDGGKRASRRAVQELTGQLTRDLQALFDDAQARAVARRS